MENNNITQLIRLHTSWYEMLKTEFDQPYFQQLKQYLIAEREQYIIYPPGAFIFRAFDSTPFNCVKVVLIGQDPYHGQGQAEGLSFSVPHGIKAPPSLKNIFKELYNDLGILPPQHGNLTRWTQEGVLLLNAVLTVRAGQPGSHSQKGWEIFTDQVIRTLSAQRTHLVFLLWGRYAAEKSNLIDTEKHLILKAAHPSPYSAATGFFGCKHFSKTNQYLQKHNIQPVNWQL
ncbi:MAG: uracil-DNA glycosylase [Flavobacteriales bacterium]|nr:uracil-DNA glycosylase [Flavobacteriales bacterium]